MMTTTAMTPMTIHSPRRLLCGWRVGSFSPVLFILVVLRIPTSASGGMSFPDGF